MKTKIVKSHTAAVTLSKDEWLGMLCSHLAEHHPGLEMLENRKCVDYSFTDNENELVIIYDKTEENK
jgi:hypothetical protein